jgi:hypothetical protein
VTPQGTPVRFTCRGRHVWATLLGEVSGTVTVPGVDATLTTVVDGRDGTLTWRTARGGIEVDLDRASGVDGTSVRFLDVTASPEAE